MLSTYQLSPFLSYKKYVYIVVTNRDEGCCHVILLCNHSYSYSSSKLSLVGDKSQRFIYKIRQKLSVFRWHMHYPSPES